MAFNNYLEDENDKPYFTTNSLAYYYDKMEGFAKAVEGSAKTLNLTKEEVEKRLTLYIEQNKNELDQRLAQWDGKLETFDSSVETLLTEWVDDGTLINIIDSTLIDQKIAPVAAQLEESLSVQPIYLENYGVSSAATATNNTTNINRAIRDAELSGRAIIIPSLPTGQYIDINGELNFTMGGIEIFGFGKSSRLRQTKFGEKLFHVNFPNVKIRDMALYGVAFDATGTGAKHVMYAGVYIATDNVTVDNIYSNKLSAVINATAPNTSKLMTGISVTNIESGNDVVFNLLVSGTDGIKFDNIHGSYRLLPGVGTPPHLIYFSQATTDGRGGDNFNIKGGYCYAKDGKDSGAFKFVGVRGGDVDHLHAETCEGSFTADACSDLNVRKLVSRNDTCNSPQGAGSFIIRESSKIIVDEIELQLSASGRAITIYNTSFDCLFKKVDIITNHNVDESLFLGGTDLEVGGNNNTIINPSVRNIGTIKHEASIRLVGGESNTIINPTTDGNQVGISIREGQHNVYNYDVTKQTNFVRAAVEVIAPNSKIYLGEKPTHRSRLIAFDNVSLNTKAGYMSKETVSYTASGHLWVIPVGNFTIDSLKGHYTTAGGFVDGSSAWVDHGKTNIEANADIRVRSQEALTVRVIDSYNFIGVRLAVTENKAYIYEYNGTRTPKEVRLAEVPFNVRRGRVYEHKVVVFDDVIDFYIDGKLLCSAVLSAELMTKYGGSTNHGFLLRATGGQVVSGEIGNLEWHRMD